MSYHTNNYMYLLKSQLVSLARLSLRVTSFCVSDWSLFLHCQFSRWPMPWNLRADLFGQLKTMMVMCSLILWHKVTFVCEMVVNPATLCSYSFVTVTVCWVLYNVVLCVLSSVVLCVCVCWVLLLCVCVEFCCFACVLSSVALCVCVLSSAVFLCV